MSDEALEFIVKLWTAEDLVSFEGAFYKGVNLAMAPKPGIEIDEDHLLPGSGH